MVKGIQDKGYSLIPANFKVRSQFNAQYLMPNHILILLRFQVKVTVVR
ncbi:hypothetical protein [Nostoc sp.]